MAAVVRNSQPHAVSADHVPAAERAPGPAPHFPRTDHRRLAGARQSGTPELHAPGYQSGEYALSIVEFGTPRNLRRSGGWLLERDVSGGPVLFDNPDFVRELEAFFVQAIIGRSGDSNPLSLNPEPSATAPDGGACAILPRISPIPSAIEFAA